MTGDGAVALATTGLTKRYGERVALAGLDLSVPAGVVYGFLGPNGAGKTTTMRILTGLIHPDAGTVELLGRPFARGDRRRLFGVGSLIESPSFYPFLSGRENLRALAATGAPVPAGRIETLLGLVGLTDRARDKVSGYSLGMRQRLGIAGALLSDPRLLLLDEPANGLDPAGIVGMRDTLRTLADEGRTVFVSSHILSEVEQLVDVVGIIDRGRLVREGPIGELLAEQATIRVRVSPAEEQDAAAVLVRFTDAATIARRPDATGIWLAVPLKPERSADVNRALADAGVYASGLEVGSNLEELFLGLTGESAATPADGAGARPGWHG